MQERNEAERRATTLPVAGIDQGRPGGMRKAESYSQFWFLNL